MSGQYVGKGLADAAYTLTRNILNSKHDYIVKLLSVEESDPNCASRNNNVMHIRDMIYILESEFGLWTTEDPIPEQILEVNSMSNDKKPKNNKDLLDNLQGGFMG